MRNSVVFILFLVTIRLGFSQNGKILSQNLIDLSQFPIWNKISHNDTLLPEFQHLQNLNIYRIIYESDDLAVNGIFMEPKASGKYPVILFNRGGNRDYGSLNIPLMVFFNSKLAAEGYVIIASNYRTKDEFGGKELNDVTALYNTIKSIEKADTSSIGMLGWSRGGMMTYLALKHSCKLKTAVIGNGPTNCYETIESRPKMETGVFAECIPNYWENKEIELKKRSALFWSDSLCPTTSILLLCGTNDQRVNPIQAREMAKKLEANNFDFEFHEYETDHFFSEKKPDLQNELIKWFEAHLK